MGAIAAAVYLVLGLLWLVIGRPPGQEWLIAAWFVLVAAAEAFVPGEANQVSLARAYLVAPALAYALAPGHLGALAVVLAVAGLTDLVDGTVARRFERPSMFGGGLDPVVDGVFLGAVVVGLALGGELPFWLAMVIVARYALPAIGGLVLISAHRSLELRHTLIGQVSTSLNIILVGGVCLFRFFKQDASNVVLGAEVVIPITTIATFVQLAWIARRRRPAAASA